MEGVFQIFSSLVFTNFLPKDLPTSLIVPSKSYCAKGCVIDTNCQSFFYVTNEKTKVCYHLSQVLQSTTGLIAQDNVGYYHVQKANGGWSAWSVTSSGACTLTCGGGQQTIARERTCSNPIPGLGGAPCSGASADIQTQTCNTLACAVDGAWATWTVASTGSCSVTCGGGQQSLSRVRTCTNPSPAHGGSNCPGSSSDNPSQSCNTTPCPVDGAWAAWTVASTGSCSVTCGGGQQSLSRVRTCTNPSPAHGGSNCPGSSSDNPSQSCNTTPCPVDGAWAAWTVASTGSCSVTCGGGQQSLSRVRTCTNPSPAHGGSNCPGSSSDNPSQSCNTTPCPVDGAWAAWTVAFTGSCSVTCGGGQQSLSRVRTCTNPSPAHGGSNCPGSSSDNPSQSCNTTPCPVTCPTSTGYIHEPSVNVCYKITTVTRNWNNARSYCQADGGDLISLQTSTKDTFIRKAIYDIIGNKDVDYFIGGQQTSTPGSWKWVDGTSISGFSMSDSSKMCLEIDKDILDDDFCSNVQRFVCEIVLT